MRDSGYYIVESLNSSIRRVSLYDSKSDMWAVYNGSISDFKFIAYNKVIRKVNLSDVREF